MTPKVTFLSGLVFIFVNEAPVLCALKMRHVKIPIISTEYFFGTSLALTTIRDNEGKPKGHSQEGKVTSMKLHTTACKFNESRSKKFVSFYFNLYFKSYGAYEGKHYQTLFWSVFGPADRYFGESYFYQYA